MDESDEATPAAVDLDAAAALALARARGTARAQGLRPGAAPRKKRRAGPELSSARRDGRDPSLLGDQIEALTAGRGWEVDVAAGSVMGRWPAIVGIDVARHTTPVTFEDGVLTVRADSTAWATQLRLMSQVLLGRIAREAGEGAVRELRITGPSAPSWAKGPRKAPGGRGPRDTYG